MTVITAALATVFCGTSASRAATNSGIPTLPNWGVTSQCAAPYTGDNTAEIRDTAENASAHIVFAVGSFGCAVSPSDPSATLPYDDLVPIEETTGAVAVAFAPHTFNGDIYAAAVDPVDNLLIVGGDFTTVDGSAVAAKHVAAFDLNSGVLQTPFNASVNGSVRSLLYNSGRLYVGGRFTAIQKIARSHLGAVDMPGGQLDAAFVPPAINWTATTKTAATDVRTLALDDTGTALYAGGHFDTVGGSVHESLLRVAASTGVLDTTFAPALDVSTDPNYVDLQAVDKIVWVPAALDGTAGIVVAQAAHINRAYQFAVSGARKWTIRPDGDMQAAAISGSSVYLGGHFACIANCLKGSTIPPVSRIHIAAVNLTSGATDTAFVPKMEPNVSPYFFGVWTLQVTANGQLWAGGAFKTVQNAGTSYPRPKLGVFPQA